MLKSLSDAQQQYDVLMGRVYASPNLSYRDVGELLQYIAADVATRMPKVAGRDGDLLSPVEDGQRDQDGQIIDNSSDP